MFICTASFIYGSWLAHSKAFGKVLLDFDDYAVKYFYPLIYHNHNIAYIYRSAIRSSNSQPITSLHVIISPTFPI